jgi:UTP--glucose-1-phosphate uridylyltransferase
VSVLDGLDPDLRQVLDRYGFDPQLFETLRARVAAGTLSRETNVVGGAVSPPGPEDLTPLPEPGTARWAEARSVGLELIGAGRVGQIVLAGGMATRFGGVVKGAVEAVDGRSFLEWKLGETARLARQMDTRIPVALMTSFATDELTRAHLAGRDVVEPLWFSQFVSLRLTREGGLFDEEGGPSLYGPGHGDLLEAVRTTGTLDRHRRDVVTLVSVSNVDNLGARVDPVVVGAHVLAGRPVSVEVAAKEGDMGGAPARVGGRVVLLESMRFPPGFDQDSIPVFNTNTSLLELDALDRPYDLGWLYVEKEVGGRTAVQLERLYHEITTFVPTTYLVVPRSGARGRFFPIKTPADLEGSRERLRSMLAESLGR